LISFDKQESIIADFFLSQIRNFSQRLDEDMSKFRKDFGPDGPPVDDDEGL
jgi:hypothetical protein